MVTTFSCERKEPRVCGRRTDVVHPDPPTADVVPRDEEAGEQREEGEEDGRERVGDDDVGRQEADDVTQRDGEQVGEQEDAEEDEVSVRIVLQARNEVQRDTTCMCHISTIYRYVSPVTRML